MMKFFSLFFLVIGLNANELKDAISDRNVEEVRRLISLNVDIVDDYNSTFSSPLMFSTFNIRNQYDDGEIIKLLIDAKANVNVKNRFGETALMQGAYAYAKKKLKEGRFNENIQFDYLETVKLLFEAKANLNVKNKRGETAPTIAKRRGNTEIVKLLKKAVAL